MTDLEDLEARFEAFVEQAHGAHAERIAELEAQVGQRDERIAQLEQENREIRQENRELSRQINAIGTVEEGQEATHDQRRASIRSMLINKANDRQSGKAAMYAAEIVDHLVTSGDSTANIPAVTRLMDEIVHTDGFYESTGRGDNKKKVRTLCVDLDLLPAYASANSALADSNPTNGVISSGEGDTPRDGPQSGGEHN